MFGDLNNAGIPRGFCNLCQTSRRPENTLEMRVHMNGELSPQPLSF